MAQADILYVEDNEDYIDFMKRVMRKMDTTVSMTVSTDSKAALSTVKNNDNSPRYRLILLDIHMPGLNGIEVLQRIREQKELTRTPVIMLSTSDNPKDVEVCYRAGANGYVIKPVGLQSLTSAMKYICDYWLNCNYPHQN